MSKATFGAGCFWHIEETFMNVKDVASTAVGYMGGNFENPTYEDVCSHKTGHAEVVQIAYDPKKVSYKELLEVFWKIHDPTSLNRQGPDIGAQYRSVIFYHNKKQKKEAEASMKKQQKHYGNRIVTEITQTKKFWKAEEDHQKYLQKSGMRACKIL